jgi:hypothetical protein
MKSLIHNSDLPTPLYSSGVLNHRDQPTWRGQALIGIGAGGKLVIWSEYKENFSEQFELIYNFENIDQGYSKALKQLITRGYLVEDENQLSQAEAVALSEQLLEKTIS